MRSCVLASYHLHPEKYEEARRGEDAKLAGNDLYGWDLNEVDPIAVFQNFACEVEKLMGIYPNVPKLTDINEAETEGESK